LRRDFGENATCGQAICVTGFHAKAFILLENGSAVSPTTVIRADPSRDLLRLCNMTRRATRPPNVLVIAGSDSGGGAGIQADLRTLAAHGVHGLCVISAITAQNTRRVSAIESVSPRMVQAQLDAVFADFPVDAVKIGMLATPAIVRVVAAELKRHPRIKVVLDPVLVATTGARLAYAGLGDALRRHLIERADLVTPNIPEAESLLGRRLAAASDLAQAAADFLDLGARAVLLKGGHLRGPRVADLLATPDRPERWFRHARIAVEGHGTGCTLSSAIAARLALGDTLELAVETAIGFVHRALVASYRPGRGRLHVLDTLAAAPRRTQR
jgi:hydroxymethylpyrimidine/phosphomethylpyrimidine kinase